MKNFTLLSLLFLCACNQTYKDNFIKISGKAQGTTYHVNYLEKDAIVYEREIDSILKVIDNSLSTYNKSSLLTKFNSSDSSIRIDDHILNVFLKSAEIHQHSDGAFDPTVKSLVDFWGFGTEKINILDKIDKDQVDSILEFTGLKKVKLYEKSGDNFHEYGRDTILANGDYYLAKLHPSVQLDFNAIAQGYSVDEIAEFLESKGLENFLVEIGGEVRVKGINPKGKPWEIGIDKPSDESKLDRPLQATVTLKNMSLATSGNYRKFFMKDGIKYSHTIDTKTGFPVQQKPTMLSVTVLAEDCISADGYATAIMAMGLENARDLIKNNDFLQAYIVYEENGEWKSFITDKMKEIMNEKK